MRKLINAVLILMIFMTVQSCDLIGDIFRAGVWAGIVIVVVVIVLIFYLISRRRKR